MTTTHRNLLLLLVVLTASCFYSLLFAPFNSVDDRKLITFLINHDTLPLSWHFFPGGTESYYRPLVSLSFAFDELAWGLEESFMHLENILVHLLNTGLVFFLALTVARILARNGTLISDWLPLIAAALFAFHPANVEAVAWISARADLLAGLFVLASLIALLLSLHTGSLLWGLTAVILMGAGCLSKETVLFLLPGAGLLLFTRESTESKLSTKRRLLLLCVLCLLVGGYFLLRSHALANDEGISISRKVIQATAAPVSTSHIDGKVPESLRIVDVEVLGQQVWQGVTATGFYFRKMLFPWPLNFAIHRVHAGWFWVGMIVWSVAVSLLWCRRLVATLLLTSLALLCSALIVSISPVAWTPYAERYLYAPLGPMIVGVVFWLGPYCQDVARRKIAIALLAPLLLAFAGTVLWRSYIWQDNLRLYQDTHEKSPDFARVKNELANALAERGRRSEGVALLNESRVLSNQLAVAGHTAVLIENDDLAGARDFLADRLSKTPGHTVEILEELIGITNKMAARTEDGQLKQGYYRDILGWLEQLERLTHNPFHWYRLGRIHLLLGDRVNARRCFAEAARRMPVNSPYHAPAKKLAETL